MCFPGILGRTCDRPCEPACRRGRVEKGAGRDLPAQARRRRFQGRHPRSAAQAGREQERQAHRAGGRRPGLARGGAGPRPDGLRMRRVRSGSEIRRHDAHANSEIPPAGNRDRRGMQLHPRSRHRIRRRQAHRQPEGAARRRLRRDFRRLRRAARPRSRHSRPQGSGQEHSHRHRLALQRFIRSHRQDRQARDRARRRQHRDGLLPLLAPARRRRC